MRSPDNVILVVSMLLLWAVIARAYFAKKQGSIGVHKFDLIHLSALLVTFPAIAALARVNAIAFTTLQVLTVLVVAFLSLPSPFSSKTS